MPDVSTSPTTTASALGRARRASAARWALRACRTTASDSAGRAAAMLSSTTTMEVGIDIGALRAEPPGLLRRPGHVLCRQLEGRQPRLRRWMFGELRVLPIALGRVAHGARE